MMVSDRVDFGFVIQEMSQFSIYSRGSYVNYMCLELQRHDNNTGSVCVSLLGGGSGRCGHINLLELFFF